LFVSLDTISVSFQIFLVFELHWILLIFAFWPRQETGFEASERNRDASHASTARKLILDAPRTIRMAAVLARAFPNWFLETKTERGWEEREKRKRRKEEKGEREKRRQQTAPHHGPSVARAKRALLFG
jgi:hypothetical protein